MARRPPPLEKLRGFPLQLGEPLDLKAQVVFFCPGSEWFHPIILGMSFHSLLEVLRDGIGPFCHDRANTLPPGDGARQQISRAHPGRRNGPPARAAPVLQGTKTPAKKNPAGAGLGGSSPQGKLESPAIRPGPGLENPSEYWFRFRQSWQLVNPANRYRGAR